MKTFKKFIALMLVCVIITGMWTPAYAANSAGVTYTAGLDHSTINVSASEQTVVMTVNASTSISVDGVQFTAVVPDGWSLAAIENETLTFPDNEVNLENGKVAYSSADGDNKTTRQIAKITYTIPANTPVGSYELGIKDLVLSADSGTVWEKGGAVSATLTVKQVSADAGKITVEAVKGRAGETVDVVVSMEKNPGIVTLLLKLGYDADVMTLTAVNDAGILGTAMHTDDLTMNPYQLTWNNGTVTSNFTSVGNLVTLSFTISEDAEEGTYPITLDYSYDDTMNLDMDSVEFATEGSVLTVSNVVVGDVNGDGAINMKDSVLLSRYVAKWSGYDGTKVDLAAADTNGDGAINMKDSVILSRYVAKWSGYTELPHN